jgi:hypothetical protein
LVKFVDQPPQDGDVSDALLLPPVDFVFVTLISLADDKVDGQVGPILKTVRHRMLEIEADLFLEKIFRLEVSTAFLKYSTSATIRFFRPGNIVSGL